MLAAGLLLVVVGYGPVIRSGYWRARASVATGRVVDHVEADPVVEFEVRGMRVRFRGGAGPAAAPPVGSTLPVLYDPGDPRRACLAEPRLAARPTVWLTVGMVVIVGGIFFTWL